MLIRRQVLKHLILYSPWILKAKIPLPMNLDRITKGISDNYYSGFFTSQVILIFALTESAAEQYLLVAILATFSKVSNEVSGETRVYLE